MNCSKESVESHLSVDFDNPQLLDNSFNDGQQNQNTPQNIYENVDIEIELEMFDPEPMTADESIFQYWHSRKNQHQKLYELAKCIFAIPPTEVDIERDFSKLNFIFTERRRNLSQEYLEAILRIHLNKDLFFVIKDEELSELRPNS